jgi:hypothetical protein
VNEYRVSWKVIGSSQVRYEYVHALNVWHAIRLLDGKLSGPARAEVIEISADRIDLPASPTAVGYPS